MCKTYLDMYYIMAEGWVNKVQDIFAEVWGQPFLYVFDILAKVLVKHILDVYTILAEVFLNNILDVLNIMAEGRIKRQV